ncbi:Carbonic anhydrase [Fulvivirga imtechensis AK7]|uniref:Carbonic anhydrase n=1 Tax=Fulvivirga imtechensis AK7 TaxID=1237149 RepID=L8JXT5_9BACT|nr:carbonic anhydrase [Fulvivirga imtechensis]ELR73590.1 Carbonic anhydrase [Fulvivirga imtechensis AK7]
MEKIYNKLIEGNAKWVEEKMKLNPDYFVNLAKGQSPEFLWIGCSDSRVPANEITGTKSGEIFVHRNVANMVVHTDLNFLSVLQYAVQVLKVKHIIVCGHYGCGGVLTAMSDTNAGLVNNWLRNIKDVYDKYADELNKIEDKTDRANKLVEYNTFEQAANLAKTSIVQEAWAERDLHIHAWVYGMGTGKIKELGITFKGPEDIKSIYHYNFPVKV